MVEWEEMLSDGIALSFETIKACLFNFAVDTYSSEEKQSWNLDVCYRMVEEAHRSRWFSPAVMKVALIISMICKVKLEIYESIETVGGMTFHALSIPNLIDTVGTPFLCSVKMWHLNHGVNALMPLIPVDSEQFNFVTLDAIRRHTQTKLAPSDDDDTSVAPSHLDEDSSSSTSDDNSTVNDAFSQDEMIEGEDTSCQFDNVHVDPEGDHADHLVNARCKMDNIDAEVKDMEGDLANYPDNPRCQMDDLDAKVEEVLADHHYNIHNQPREIEPTWVHVMVFPLEDDQYQISMVIIDSSPTQYCFYP